MFGMKIRVFFIQIKEKCWKINQNALKNVKFSLYVNKFTVIIINTKEQKHKKMGNTCSRKGARSNTNVSRSNLPNDNLQNVAVTTGVARTAQNVRHGNKATVMIPTNYAHTGVQGPGATLTNYIHPQTTAATVNNVIGDPYLNASYVKVADYGSMQGIRTTNDVYPAYGPPETIVNKTTHTTVIDVPAQAANNGYVNTGYTAPMNNTPVEKTPLPYGVTGVRDRERSRSSSSERRRASGNTRTEVYRNGDVQRVVTTQVTPIQPAGLRY